MSFWNRKITSDEYADALNKIFKLNNEMLLLRAEVERMETRLKSFHGKLIRHNDIEEQQVETMYTPQQMQQIAMGVYNPNPKD